MDSLNTLVIYILHFLFFLFIIIVPFVNNNYLTLLHIIIVPFIIFHWLLDDHTCSVVFVEKKLNYWLFGCKEGYNGFFANLIEPVYDFKKNHSEYAGSIYSIAIILWLISVTKIFSKYGRGQIKSFDDLFR